MELRRACFPRAWLDLDLSGPQQTLDCLPSGRRMAHTPLGPDDPHLLELPLLAVLLVEGEGPDDCFSMPLIIDGLGVEPRDFDRTPLAAVDQDVLKVSRGDTAFNVD